MNCQQAMYVAIFLLLLALAAEAFIIWQKRNDLDVEFPRDDEVFISQLAESLETSRRRVQWLEEDLLSAGELAAVIEVFAACSSSRMGSGRRDEILRKLNRRAVKAVGE